MHTRTRRHFAGNHDVSLPPDDRELGSLRARPPSRQTVPALQQPIAASDAERAIDPATRAALASIQPETETLAPVPNQRGPLGSNAHLPRAAAAVSPPLPRVDQTAPALVERKPASAALPAVHEAPIAKATGGSPSMPALTDDVLHTPRNHAWLGWLTAAALLAVGIGFALEYAQLQRELIDTKRESAQQLRDHAARLATVRAELERSRDRIERLAAAEPRVVHESSKSHQASEARSRARAQNGVRREHALGGGREAAPARETARTRPQDARKPEGAARDRSSRAQARRTVDRAAAAAATAELEAETYRASPPEPRQEHSGTESVSRKATKEHDALAGIARTSSDDPLEGL
jgi:hypothetical protein